MNDENKHWEDLASGLDIENQDQNPIKSNASPKLKADLQWATQTKSQLYKAFLWDYFDKKEAKLRVEYRLKSKQAPIRKLLSSAWTRAAILLLAILSGALIHNILMVEAQSTAYSEIIVPPGQMTQLKLSDGSTIYLNSGTKFKYPTSFNQSKREVYIDGEAYMNIAKNKRSPFIVSTSNFSVEVLGTSFNVSAYSTDERANVTLVEGSVLLRSEIQSWSKKLIPGQIARSDNGGKPVIEEVNTEFYTSWIEGKIVFRRETLGEIAKKLERWYNVDIRFDEPSLETYTFSGTFLKFKPIEQVFQSFKIMDERIDFIVNERADQKNLIQIKKRM